MTLLTGISTSPAPSDMEVGDGHKPEMPTPDMPQVLLEHHLKALRLPTILSE
jgi:hypothetical protein